MSYINEVGVVNIMSTWLTLIILLINSEYATSTCSSSDPSEECQALIDFGNALNYKYWKTNTEWMTDRTICDWYGITCKFGHITEINLESNNLSGSIPLSIGNLTKLQTFQINGDNTHDNNGNYTGCINTNLKQSSLPETIYGLNDLININLAYTCLGGTISDSIGKLINLQFFVLHSNYVSGTIPSSFDNCRNLVYLKLGRNPITGTVPAFNNLSKLQKFNCNFCAITGQFPDNLDKFPSLIELFWDGNGLNGTLPKSISAAKNLESLSFDINDLSGTIDDSLCDNPPSDCRIGSDTNYSQYNANYPWLIPVKGNLYTCPLPKCCTIPGRGCDKTDSIVNCTNSIV